VFYEMLTRRAPFEGSSAKEIMENILHAEPPLPSAVNPHVPGALDGIVSSLLAGDPDKRVPNARILLRDLHRLEAGLGLGPGAGAGSGEPTARPPPGRAEPTLRTPAANQSRERELPREASLPPRGQAEPAAPQPTQDAPRLDEHDARFTVDRDPRPARPSGSRAGSFAALALMLAVGLAVVLYYSPSPREPRVPASGMQEATAAAPSPSAAPPPVAEATKEPATAPAAPEASPAREMADARAERQSSGVAAAPNPLPPRPLVAEPSLPALTVSLPAREPEQPAAAQTAPAQERPRAAQPAAKISEPQPGGTARLILAVSPQGELYIDDKHYGTTPPITTLDLEPGMHRIEIRSGSWKPYLTYMAVQVGEQRRIRHDFGAKPSGPRF
jgi:hypothetical protein